MTQVLVALSVFACAGLIALACYRLSCRVQDAPPDTWFVKKVDERNYFGSYLDAYGQWQTTRFYGSRKLCCGETSALAAFHARSRLWEQKVTDASVVDCG